MRVHSHFPVKGASNVSLGNGYISHIVNGFPGNSIDKRPFDKVFTRGNIILWWIAVRLMAMTQNVVEPEGLVGGRRKRGTRATQYLWWKRWVSFLGEGGVNHVHYLAFWSICLVLSCSRCVLSCSSCVVSWDTTQRQVPRHQHLTSIFLASNNLRLVKIPKHNDYWKGNNCGKRRHGISTVVEKWNEKVLTSPNDKNSKYLRFSKQLPREEMMRSCHPIRAG